MPGVAVATLCALWVSAEIGGGSGVGGPSVIGSSSVGCEGGGEGGGGESSNCDGYDRERGYNQHAIN